MAQYQITEKGKTEAKKKRTTAKMVGEALSFGGPWKGEEYSNMLLLELADKPKPQDVHEITVGAFNKPRPSETKIARSLGNLTRRGFVRIIPTGRTSRTGFSDRSGSRLSRRSHKGFKKLRW